MHASACSYVYLFTTHFWVSTANVLSSFTHFFTYLNTLARDEEGSKINRMGFEHLRLGPHMYHTIFTISINGSQKHTQTPNQPSQLGDESSPNIIS
jgi:hypothetical protein